MVVKIIDHSPSTKPKAPPLQSTQERGTLETRGKLTGWRPGHPPEYNLKTLLRHKRQLLDQGGYPINTDKTEDIFDEVIEQFIELYNAK